MNQNKINLWIKVGAILMALAVILGAFGAHGLKPQLSEYQLDIYSKGVFYHMVHALAILISAALVTSKRVYAKRLNLASIFFLIGCVLFSGSLYILATRDIFLSIPDAFGAVTPLGGLAFIGGWLLLAFSIKSA
jgi:uncharacterized membrane protein YgdD (TMEM256/DUF423 family)